MTKQQLSENSLESTTYVSKRFFTVKNFSQKNKEQGCWPDSDAAIWALRAGSPDNGFGEAFVTIGRRVLIDEERFWEAISRLQEV